MKKIFIKYFLLYKREYINMKSFPDKDYKSKKNLEKKTLIFLEKIFKFLKSTN
jgi:hypothetical protein